MVSGVFDGGMKRYRGAGALGTSGQGEDQPALFRLADGSRLENVVVGAPAADGIHCDGTCTLYNVWWEDVGEDAATLDGTSPTQTMTIECAGAMHAADKIFQHNGPGTMILRHIIADDFSKFYRSCGNCLEQFQRHVILDDITVRRGTTVAGINENYGDVADFSNIVIYPASARYHRVPAVRGERHRGRAERGRRRPGPRALPLRRLGHRRALSGKTPGFRPFGPIWNRFQDRGRLFAPGSARIRPAMNPRVSSLAIAFVFSVASIHCGGGEEPVQEYPPGKAGSGGKGGSAGAGGARAGSGGGGGRAGAAGAPGAAGSGGGAAGSGGGAAGSAGRGPGGAGGSGGSGGDPSMGGDGM